MERKRECKHLERFDRQISARENRKTLEGMIHTFYAINEEQIEFDEDLWGGLY